MQSGLARTAFGGAADAFTLCFLAAPCFNPSIEAVGVLFMFLQGLSALGEHAVLDQTKCGATTPATARAAALVVHSCTVMVNGNTERFEEYVEHWHVL